MNLKLIVVSHSKTAFSPKKQPIVAVNKSKPKNLKRKLAKQTLMTSKAFKKQTKKNRFKKTKLQVLLSKSMIKDKDTTISLRMTIAN